MTAWSFTGTGLPGGDSVELWVDGGGRRSSAAVLDAQPLPGRFALTGLVDAHCHLSLSMGPRGPLPRDRAGTARAWDETRSAGVLAVRDVGAVDGLSLELARADPAHLRVAGRFLSSPGHYFSAVYRPVTADGLVEAALAEVAAGARWVKLIGDFRDLGAGVPRPEPTYPTESVAALVEAVHAAGARVAAHATTEVAAELVAAGVDSVEHGLALGDATIAALGARGGAWTPTACAALGPPDRDGRQQPAQVELWQHLLPAALAAGVSVLTGSDVVGTVAGEVAWLTRLGLSPEQALAAASTAARSYLELPEPVDGEPVDLVTYADDPRDDPAVLARPAAVIAAGVRLT